MAAKTKLSQSDRYHNIDLPAKNNISNFHIWFLFAAKMLFQDYELGLDIVMKTEKEFKAVAPILEYMYRHYRRYGGFKDILSPVMEDCGKADAFMVIGFGNSLQKQWTKAVNMMNNDVAEFLWEQQVPRLTTARIDTAMFRTWYESRFEATSAPHFQAYIQKARDKERLAHASLLLTTYPSESKILAVRLNPKLDSCKHYRKTYRADDDSWQCLSCGAPVSAAGMTMLDFHGEGMVY